ncbi:hypothetical protein H8959_009966, partial [Pygathrix nigripes]
DLLAGRVAIAISRTAVAPIKRLKLLLLPMWVKRAEREFRGLGDYLVKIYKSDGIKGLYQGFN